MTKHLSLLIIILLAAVTIKLQAQNYTIQAPPGYNYIYNQQDFPYGTEGSPYLDDWQHAEIVLKNGAKIADLMVRFNVYANQMLYQDKNKTYIIGAPDSISEIKFPGKTFIYKEYAKGTKTEKSFFEIVIKGKASLFNKYEVELIPSNYNIALNVGNKNNRLSLQQHMYLQNSEKFVQINKKTKLMDFLSDKNKEVSDYMDKEGLSFKTKEDIIKIVAYYNQL